MGQIDPLNSCVSFLFLLSPMYGANDYKFVIEKAAILLSPMYGANTKRVVHWIKSNLLSPMYGANYIDSKHKK